MNANPERKFWYEQEKNLARRMEHGLWVTDGFNYADCQIYWHM